LNKIASYPVSRQQAALWFLGQSGFLIRSCGVTVVIDPYLSDSVAKVSPKLTRLYPPPIDPGELKADLFIVTHDHLDHLDPETIGPYAHKESTVFVGPRLACHKLRSLGIPRQNIIQIDSGQRETVRGIGIEGIYAVPNEAAVIDTAGYRIEFENGRSVYHSADTGFSPLLLECAPQAETALVCINGLWGNLNIEQAAELVCRVHPRFAVPHHYDLMKLNSVNPEIFQYQMQYRDPKIAVKILPVLEPFAWS
jgi:L-ascorbate 6-phosphate lactonase